ncbi:hypothetical protein HID58_017383 [Brassica napus]|uniref:Uncharacterized protein n=1 Tax=Brassica napus TaxID=3708 RepID=A0ABQ8D6Z1_BRANA|nr:hypothetical protein HID58_017383 [Brassica napus]
MDSESAPTSTNFMESSPSNIINNIVQKPLVVDPLTTTPQAGVVDEAEMEQISSFSLTRSERETKPPIKYRDLEWKTVHGRAMDSQIEYAKVS